MTDIAINPVADWGGHYNGTYNTGISNTFRMMDAKHGFIRFNFSSIPAGNTCDFASLSVYNNNYALTDPVFNLYAITDDNGDWVEGTKNGAVAGAGEPCVNAKAADGSGGITTAWATPLYVDTLLANYSYVGVIPLYTKIELIFNAAGLAKLQTWFGQETNNGFYMHKASAGNCTIVSREWGTAGQRPLLSFTHTAPSGALLKVNMNAQMQSLNGGMHG